MDMSFLFQKRVPVPLELVLELERDYHSCSYFPEIP